MADVARAVGVDRSTVSLALQNHPRISRVTRDRIRQAAAKLGYVRDPLLDAFNRQRLAHRTRPSAAAVAYVHEPEAEIGASDAARQAWALSGVRRQAANCGYSVLELAVGKGGFSVARIQSICEARGIRGIVVGPLTSRVRTLPLDWTRFSGVAIECQHLPHRIACVSGDYRAGVAAAVRALRRAGHARIGLAIASGDAARLAGQPVVGFFFEASIAGPNLALQFDDALTAPDDVIGWMRGQQLTAVIAAGRAARSRCENRAWPPDILWQGVPANDDADERTQGLLGALAIDLLTLRLQAKRNDTADPRTLTLLPLPTAAAPVPKRRRAIPQLPAK